MLGHTAKTLEEFKTMAEAERFDKLLLHKPVKKGSFLNLDRQGKILPKRYDSV